MNGYVRQFDGQTQISATDMVEAVTGLLCSPAENQHLSWCDRYECQLSNFYSAYDALSLKPSSIEELLKGIQLAKELQMAIVRAGVSLIESGAVEVAAWFRLCNVQCSQSVDIALFQNPLALQKLALFITSAY